MTPANSTVGVGFTKQFAATVIGLSNKTVTWSLTGMGKNNPALGTIGATGPYTAPSTPPAQNPITVQATGSDGKTVGSTYLLIEALGPTLTSILPNPITVGTYTVTVTGTGFVSGAQVFAGAVQLSTTFVSSAKLTATGYQGAIGNVSFKAKNPGTLFSNILVVPFTSGNNGPITVSPATAQVALGATQQFTETGQSTVTWTVSAGKIDSTGLFTAPTTMPNSPTVTITASGSNNQSGHATVTLTTNQNGPITVSPATAQVALGATQQFTETGQSTVTWTATAGKIDSTGLFTAPATMPNSPNVTVTAFGSNNQSGFATVTLVNNQATPTIQSVNPSPLPIGVFTVQVTGTNFTNQSIAQLNGAPLATTFNTVTQLTVVGSASQTGTASLTVSNGALTSAPFSVQVGVANPLVTAAAARRFLEQAAFGPTPADAAHVQTIGFQAWLNEQFAMPKLSNYSGIVSSRVNCPTASSRTP